VTRTLPPHMQSMFLGEGVVCVNGFYDILIPGSEASFHAAVEYFSAAATATTDPVPVATSTTTTRNALAPTY